MAIKFDKLKQRTQADQAREQALATVGVADFDGVLRRREESV